MGICLTFENPEDFKADSIAEGDRKVSTDFGRYR
jgi:hypothetical protein